MNKKHNKIIRITLTVLAVLIMSLSIFTITFYKQVVNPELYKQALVQSNIYEITIDIFERKTAETLVSWEKKLVNSLIPDKVQENKLAQMALSFITDTVIEKQTPDLIGSIFDKIALHTLLQNIIEKQIDRDLAWLSNQGESQEIFNYIPTPGQIESIQLDKLTKLVGGITDSALGFNKLPKCTTQEEIDSNINKIMTGNYQSILCSSDQIDFLLAKQEMSHSQSQGLNSFIGKSDLVSSGSEVDVFLKDVYGVSYALAEFKQDMISIKNNIQYLKNLAYIGLLMSFILMGIAVYLRKKGSRIKYLVSTVLISGGTIMLLVGLYYIIIYFMIDSTLANIQLGTEFLTITESHLLMDSLRFIVKYIAYGFVSMTIKVGLWLLIFSGIILGILNLYNRRDSLKNKFSSLLNRK